MIKNRLKILAILFLIFCVVKNANAQAINSVYTMFGIGQLTDNNFGINRALGGTGIAFKSGRSVNYLNPASYLGLKQRSYVMETGAFGIINTAETSTNSHKGSDINFGYFSASFYLTNWWASSIGLTPFSSIDYNLSTNDQVIGELTTYEKTFSGTGGLSRLYWGNSFRLFDNLAIGVNASYIMGPITQTETGVSNDKFAGYTLNKERTVFSVYFDYGLQYTLTNGDWDYTVGMIYAPGQKLYSSDDLTFTYNDITESLELEDQFLVKVPQKFGFGVAANKGNNFRAGIDYEWCEWSKLKFNNPEISSLNTSRLSFGLEYSPANNQRGADFLSSIFYRLGGSYKNSYLELDGKQITSTSINLGFGIPYDASSIFNLSIEYGKEGTSSDGLIKNNYWMVYCNFSLHEFWNAVISK